MLVEILPAIAPQGQALFGRRGLVQAEFLHTQLGIIDTCELLDGWANGTDNHALADVPTAVFVARTIDGNDEDAALVGTASQRELPGVFAQRRLAVGCGADGHENDLCSLHG